MKFLVTVVRAADDRYGDLGPTSESTVGGCSKWPRSMRPETATQETRDYADTVTVGYVLSVPDGVDIRPTDRLRLPGDPAGSALWAVLGDALPYENPFTGRRPGMLVAIEKATG